MVAYPAGHEPIKQRYLPDTGRISGRMATEHCGTCSHVDDCFVAEKQAFYSYGFYERKQVIAHRRARLADSASEEFLNQRAGAKSMINEVYHETGKRSRFTGRTKVKNDSIATAIGTYLKRASRFINEESNGEQTAA